MALEPRDKVRLSLDVSPELNARLEVLAQATHSTKSDVLRKAIALMDVAVEARANGQKLGIANQDQPVAREIVGLGF